MKKIGLLVMVVVLAMGMLGVGYAMWDKTLFIDGTVHTGEVDAEMTVEFCYDDEIAGKDYSSISCMLDPADPQILLITVTDAYPCITYTCEFDIDNTGTVPIIVASVGSPVVPGTITVTDMAGGSLVGTQIDPGMMAYGMVVIHLDNTADELTTYTFSVPIWCVQWNEY